MDLSFIRSERTFAARALPVELAVLLVGVTARQAASPTASAQAMVLPISTTLDLLAPADGAFSGATLALLAAGAGA